MSPQPPVNIMRGYGVIHGRSRVDIVSCRVARRIVLFEVGSSVIVDATDLIGVVLRGGASWTMYICPSSRDSPEAMGMN